MATVETLTEHLLHVAKAESIPLPEESANFLARLAEGSFRDALSLLDQLQSAGPKTWDKAAIENMFGYIPIEQVTAITSAVFKGDSATAHALVSEVEASGGDVRSLWTQLLALSRQALEGRITSNFQTLPSDLEKVVSKQSIQSLLAWVELLLTAGEAMKQSPIVRLPLDVALAKFGSRQSGGSSKPIEEAKKNPEEIQPTVSSVASVVASVAERPETTKPQQVTSAPSEENETATVPVAEIINVPAAPDLWLKVLGELKGEAPSLVTSLAQAKITGLTDNQLLIGVRYKMHADKINQVRNREKIEGILSRLYDKPFKIEAHVVRELVVEEEEVDIAEIFDLEE
jgi:DNA polymerase-3 subunit gamma/tau